MARRRSSSPRWSLREWDRMQTALAAGLAALILAAVFPRFFPAAQRGPECMDLASPLGGNNRSILAQRGSLGSALDLELSIEDSSIQSGQGLEVKVTFINQHFGPVILWLSEAPPLLSHIDVANNPIPGVTFEIRRAADNTRLIDQSNPLAVPGTYDYEQLHLLGSHGRCTQTYQITAEQLARIGVQAGQTYRLRAYYTNTSSGTLPQPAFATPTATAAYIDQGVWIGRVSSDERGFSVNFAATPIPPG